MDTIELAILIAVANGIPKQTAEARIMAAFPERFETNAEKRATGGGRDTGGEFLLFSDGSKEYKKK